MFEKKLQFIAALKIFNTEKENKMTEQQELEAVCKYLKVTEEEFFEIMEVAYKKVIKKRVEKDQKPVQRSL